MRPPAASPQTMRAATSISKLVTNAHASVANAMTASEMMMSRVLLNMSASAPSTGWIRA
jgi:hypothetical protein